MGRRFLPRAFVASTLLFAVGIALAPGAGTAQDAGTPSAMMHDHPAHIHSGTCATLGDVVFPLTDLKPAGMMGTPMAGMMGTPMAGMEMGEVESFSTTQVDASLDDILSEEHAINVHESPEKIDVYIACGDLTGSPENGRLEIQLNELNDSGHEGMAVLMDNGDGTTTVDVVLMKTDHGMMGTPEATPSS